MVYILANKYDDIPLKNGVCKAIHNRYIKASGPQVLKKELVEYVYKSTLVMHLHERCWLIASAGILITNGLSIEASRLGCCVILCRLWI